MTDDRQPLQNEPELPADIQAAFDRVRVARQEKIERYKPKRKAYRQPYKEDDDHESNG